jgi:hypothetical protein
MLVSTFELLVRPITPANAGPASLARTIVQGYFLTIANTSAAAATLVLTFRATTPGIDLAKTVTIEDVTGVNTFSDLTATNNYNIAIPANDTALFILQPDVTIPSVLANKDLEIRGYVEIAVRGAGNNTFELLLTPEHRGTFFSGDVSSPGTDIDQLVYALPTALGKAQYSLSQRKSILKDLSEVGVSSAQPKVIKDVADAGVVKPVLENPNSKGLVENPSIPGNIQEVLVEMAQQVDALSAAAAEGQAFIQPSERPAVGSQILNAVGNGN